ncbi:MAG: aminoacyl-tRNA hydrolase [Alphaproteobacteria bacterium]
MHKCLVGLGNPGGKYRLTRHNIGFILIDAIASFFAFAPFSNKCKMLFSKGKIEEEEVFLCKPTTFMNLSGSAIASFMHFYKIPLSDVFVIHDDCELELGRIKVKKGGGSGGHNGISNIDQCVGKDYWRIRVGIGKPENADVLSNYVLSNFNKEDQRWILNLETFFIKAIANLFKGDPINCFKEYQNSVHSGIKNG